MNKLFVKLKNALFIIVILLFASPLKAQSYNLPPHPELGKCYERCFDYEKRLEWKEVDCEKIKLKNNQKKTKEELIKLEQEKIKMKKYQEKLKKLGYKVDITGKLDDKTIIAHHKYLRKKKKEEKRKQRKKKKRS